MNNEIIFSFPAKVSFRFKHTIWLVILLFAGSFFSSCDKTEEDLPETNYVPVTVETSPATLITYNSAMLDGVISAPQNRNVIFGFCVSTQAYPTIDDYLLTGQGEIGLISGDLTGLEPGTTYYVRAYATSNPNANNVEGTIYGNQISFTTLEYQLPTISTNVVIGITLTTAESGGTLTSDGGSAITARGVCWGIYPDPTIYDYATSNGTGTGNFTSTMIGLTPGKLYYARAYATNDLGTVYGNQLFFYTLVGLPTVTTYAAYANSSTSATSGGNVTSDGGAPVTAHGVCWSIYTNPTISNDKSIDGTGAGYYVSDMTGLTANTTYYVRAYATNSSGTGYGNQVLLTTTANAFFDLPTISTSAISMVTSNSASSGGTITSDGGATITARGVCWSSDYTPTIYNSKTIDGTGAGSFTSNMTGLTPNTVYYVRAYATNSVGTAYGELFAAITSNANALQVGQSYMGGIIAYILQPGDPGYISGETHGLIVAPDDQSTSIAWYNGYYDVYDDTSLGLGTGNENTLTIVSLQGYGSYAAQMCYDLWSGYYDDWYLPSLDELNKIFENRFLIGGLSANWYWSSSEEMGNALAIHFDTGDEGIGGLYDTAYVRAVRNF